LLSIKALKIVSSQGQERMSSLQEIFQLITDLLKSSSAVSIEVVDGDKMVRINKESYRRIGDPESANQNIQIINQMSTSITIDQKTLISNFLKTVEQVHPEKLEDAKEKVQVLKTELKKENPNWATLQSIIKWTLNFGKDAFLQLIPILLKDVS